jgi:pilus assembly protein CpaD
MPTSSHVRAQSSPRGWAAQSLLLGVFAIPGGCITADRMTTSSIPMDDYRNRHPIVLAEQARQLDIFPAQEGRSLDHRTSCLPTI